MIGPRYQRHGQADKAFQARVRRRVARYLWCCHRRSYPSCVDLLCLWSFLLPSTSRLRINNHFPDMLPKLPFGKKLSTNITGTRGRQAYKKNCAVNSKPSQWEVQALVQKDLEFAKVQSKLKTEAALKLELLCSAGLSAFTQVLNR